MLYVTSSKFFIMIFYTDLNAPFVCSAWYFLLHYRRKYLSIFSLHSSCSNINSHAVVLLVRVYAIWYCKKWMLVLLLVVYIVRENMRGASLPSSNSSF